MLFITTFIPVKSQKIEGLLYIPQDDTFYFDFKTVRLEGQVSIYIGGEERFYFESKEIHQYMKVQSFRSKPESINLPYIIRRFQNIDCDASIYLPT